MFYFGYMVQYVDTVFTATGFVYMVQYVDAVFTATGLWFY